MFEVSSEGPSGVAWSRGKSRVSSKANSTGEAAEASGHGVLGRVKKLRAAGEQSRLEVKGTAGFPQRRRQLRELGGTVARSGGNGGGKDAGGQTLCKPGLQAWGRSRSIAPPPATFAP